VDTTSELSWFIKRETGSEKGGIKEKPDEILDGLIRFISSSL
jgi:hypothetical protein